MTRSLAREIARVVDNGNCSGCGACALISNSVSMELDSNQWMRPVVAAESNLAEDAKMFRKVCPGVIMRKSPREDRKEHETFGAYVSSWRAHAVDEEVRESGSSAGVLTSLSQFLIESGRAQSVVAAGPSERKPTRTVPVTIQTRDQALRSSGSRYAPVSVLAGFDSETSAEAVSAKPCEISALRRFYEEAKRDELPPLLLSFFCAGTPSQQATDTLISRLGVAPEEVEALRYRGNGWPGFFTAASPAKTGTLSYEDSWGKHLGRDLQWRCKICPDGTGEDSDVSVGDFWEADENGYPSFEEVQGSSVAIARTERGHALLLAAEAAGVISLEPVSLDEVARIQPLQVNRKQTLAVRLAARLLTGKRVPRYVGYGLLKRAAKRPRVSAKAFARSVLRSGRGRG